MSDYLPFAAGQSLAHVLKNACSYLEDIQNSFPIEKPVFAVIGKQGAGKTSLLPFLGLQGMGEASNLGCATRCRVTYHLDVDKNTSCKIAVCTDASAQPQDEQFEEIPFEELTSEVESRQGNDFDAGRVLHVRIQAPKALPCIIHDLPGCPSGDGNDAANSAVQTMWELVAGKSVVIPLIVTDIPESFDVAEFQDDLTNIKRFMADNLERCPQRYILATHLERFHSNGDRENLVIMRDKACEVFHVSKRDVFFVSLQPHLLAQPTATSLGSSWRDDRRTNALSNERDFMAKFLETKVLDKETTLLFGIENVYNAVVPIIMKCLRTNGARVARLMEKHGIICMEKLKKALNVRPEVVVNEATDFTMLLISGLGAFARSNSAKFYDSLFFIKRKHGYERTIYMPKPNEVLPFMSPSKVSLKDSCKYFERLAQPTGSMFLTDPFFLDGINCTTDSPLGHMSAHKLCSGAAIEYMLEIFKLWVIKRELREYSGQELVNMANYVGSDGSTCLKISDIVKKAHSEHSQVIHSQVGFLCQLIVLMYKSAYEPVFETVVQHCIILEEHPSVRDYIVTRVKEIFEEYLDNVLRDSQDKMYSMIEEHFNTFDTGDIFNTLGLLGCINLPAIEAVAQMPVQVGPSTSSSSSASTSGPLGHSTLTRIPNNLNDYVTSSNATSGGSPAPTQQFDGNPMTMTSKVLQCSTERWATSGCVPFIELSNVEEICAFAKVINKAWHAFARFSFGKCAQRICDIVRSDIVRRVCSMDTQLLPRITDAVLNPLKDNPGGELSPLLDPQNEATMKHLNDIEASARTWLNVAREIAEHLGEAPSMAEVQRCYGELREIRQQGAWLREEEASQDIQQPKLSECALEKPSDYDLVSLE